MKYASQAALVCKILTMPFSSQALNFPTIFLVDFPILLMTALFTIKDHQAGTAPLEGIFPLLHFSTSLSYIELSRLDVAQEVDNAIRGGSSSTPSRVVPAQMHGGGNVFDKELDLAVLLRRR